MIEICMSNLNEQILCKVTEFYLNSSRFNGIPLGGLLRSLNIPDQDALAVLSQLVQDSLLSLNFGDTHPNPHIKAFSPENPEVQLKKLAQSAVQHCCVYPEPTYLESVVDRKEYEESPFTLRLALGEPQLKHAAFRLEVLESYRNDPRYYYRHNDISGTICLKDEYYQSQETPESDQVLLDTFGFAYDENLNRAVASFLWYLSCLSPEHQQIWHAKELGPEYMLHPDYYRTSIIGHFPGGISIFQSFLYEQRIINEMSLAMDRETLFLRQINPDNKPREFSFLIRPTLKEFNEFVHLLDKLLSDNINSSFFKSDVPLEEEFERPDGKVEVRRKGTLRLLEEWLRPRFSLEDSAPIDEMFSTFRKIRKMRQKPAHKIDENEFDQEYFRVQRKLIIEACKAVNILRQIFALHPAAAKVEIPDYIEGKVWTY